MAGLAGATALAASLQSFQRIACLSTASPWIQLRHLHWGRDGDESTRSNNIEQNTETTIKSALPSTSAESFPQSICEHVAALSDGATTDLGIYTAGATALDALHTATGLPWVAVIPAAAVTIKTLLLPLSIKQAKIIRTNVVLWKEAHELLKQHHAKSEQQQQQQAGTVITQQGDWPLGTRPHHQQRQQQPMAGANGSLDAGLSALQQLQEWQDRLQLFHKLRRKCGVPHPSWLIVNGSLQACSLIYASATIRCMSQSNWPGFNREGALWFSDLTKPAVVLAAGGIDLPMGLPGLTLPLAATGFMMTSIYLGFKASGAAAKHPSLQGSWMATFLTWLQPLLYSLTLASSMIKVQLPQAPVLHWAISTGYTLGLQLSLKSPRVRQWLGISQAGSIDSSKDIDPAVAAQAAAMDNSDVLVVMGAKYAAMQKYNEAIYCLQRALQLNPLNARAHYSAGQIYGLKAQWPESEASYRQAAQLSGDPAVRSQALYCVGVACHQQGLWVQAEEAYRQAMDAGPPESLKPVLALSTARSLIQAGKTQEAAAVARQELESETGMRCAAALVAELQRLAAGTGAEQQGPGPTRSVKP